MKIIVQVSRLNTLAKKFSMNVDMVTTRDLQTQFDSMDAAPRTVRNFRSHASTLFKFAEARGKFARLWTTAILMCCAAFIQTFLKMRISSCIGGTKPPSLCARAR